MAIKNEQSRETGNILDVGYTRRRKTKQKHNIICVGHNYTQTNNYNVNKTWALKQTTWGKDEPNIVKVWRLQSWKGICPIPVYFCIATGDVDITRWVVVTLLLNNIRHMFVSVQWPRFKLASAVVISELGGLRFAWGVVRGMFAVCLRSCSWEVWGLPEELFVFLW